MLRAETTGQISVNSDNWDAVHEENMREQREAAFRDARRNLTEYVYYGNAKGSARLEAQDIQAQMDTMEAGPAKGALRLKRETIERGGDRDKKIASAAYDIATKQYAFWKDVKIHQKELHGVGKDGSLEVTTHYVVDGDDAYLTHTRTFFEDFNTFVEQHASWLADEEGFVRPADWPKDEDEEARLQRERVRRPLNEDMLIKADPTTVLKSQAAIEGAEYFALGLMLSSSTNSKIYALHERIISTGSMADLESKLADMRQSLDYKKIFEELSVSDALLCRDVALNRAGAHLSALRSAGLIPKSITARNAKDFTDQVKKTYGLAKWQPERKANIDVLKSSVLSTREYNQKAGNLGETVTKREASES